MICSSSVYHTFKPKEGSIGFSLSENFKITLNGSNEYVVYISDPKFGFPTINPAAVPRTALLMRKNSLTVLFLKVQFNRLFVCWFNSRRAN